MSNFDEQQLTSELAALLNRHGIENGSNTPDFVLAHLLVGHIKLWNLSVIQREHFHGRGNCLERPEHTAENTGPWTTNPNVND